MVGWGDAALNTTIFPRYLPDLLVSDSGGGDVALNTTISRDIYQFISQRWWGGKCCPEHVHFPVIFT